MDECLSIDNVSKTQLLSVYEKGELVAMAEEKDVKKAEKKNAWLSYSEEVKKDVFQLNDGYKKYISLNIVSRKRQNKTVQKNIGR